MGFVTENRLSGHQCAGHCHLYELAQEVSKQHGPTLGASNSELLAEI